jgi:hypothetical protein
VKGQDIKEGKMREQACYSIDVNLLSPFEENKKNQEGNCDPFHLKYFYILPVVSGGLRENQSEVRVRERERTRTQNSSSR